MLFLGHLFLLITQNLNNKDPVVEEFYQELFKHWRLKKGVKIPCVAIDDDEGDDPNVDLSALFEVKAESGEDQDVASSAGDASDVEELTAPQDPYMPVMGWVGHTIQTSIG